MMTNLKLILTIPLYFAFCSGLMGAINVSVQPTSVTLSAGQRQQFSASLTGAKQGVKGVSWSVSPSVGSISGTGLYSAPASIASQERITVTATSVADTTKSATASITLMPISVSVSPTTATLSAGQTQQFTSNIAVTW